MKVLLDENLPWRLKKALQEFEVFTVQDMGWNGKENGELLKLLLQDGFEVMITADKNLKHQQNFSKYPIPVIVLNVRLLTYDHILPLLDSLKNHLVCELPVGVTLLSGN
ncbi:MAG: DUF5615 family PIN-like protein [Cyclobacteriaceae bacterium]